MWDIIYSQNFSVSIVKPNWRTEGREIIESGLKLEVETFETPSLLFYFLLDFVVVTTSVGESRTRRMWKRDLYFCGGKKKSARYG